MEINMYRIGWASEYETLTHLWSLMQVHTGAYFFLNNVKH